MFNEQATHDTNKENLELLCDVENFMSLTYIIPMLEMFKACQSLFKAKTFSCVILLLP
jgi:hypothetical protein